jgi:hypothetical protein
MKKYLSLAVTVWFATIALSIAAAPDKDAIMAKEKEAWQAFKDKNADGFKKVADKDFRGVLRRGRRRPETGIGGHAEVGHEIVRLKRLQRVLG